MLSTPQFPTGAQAGRYRERDPDPALVAGGAAARRRRALGAAARRHGLPCAEHFSVLS
jgi:hypothetical protein